MTRERYYTVIADVNEDQYLRLTNQSHSDPYRFRPKLHRFSKDGTAFTEDNIADIIADAIHISANTTHSQKLMAEENLEQASTSAWPLDMKDEIMTYAMEHWQPGDHYTTSAWDSPTQANAFLESHPELLNTFERPSEETARLWAANHQREAEQSAAD